MRSKTILLLGVAASLIAFSAEGAENGGRLEERRALAQAGLVDTALVVSWNQTINDIGFAEPSPGANGNPNHAGDLSGAG